MTKIYRFVGGRFAGITCEKDLAEAVHQTEGNGRTDNCTRNEHLRNELKFKGYLGPMADGINYKVDGVWLSGYDLTEQEKVMAEKAVVLRYETQEVYDMLSR